MRAERVHVGAQNQRAHPAAAEEIQAGCADGLGAARIAASTADAHVRKHHLRRQLSTTVVHPCVLLWAHRTCLGEGEGGWSGHGRSDGGTL